ncbi:hypothetical protein [Pseudomonas sp. MWU16-30317]|uniref:hypothetical protein n=1 Tax=Pseudomonas sp. MWU16-30317 TaxID=2878095 RepID=UPI001CF97712|nr:hypothetical protein [Pseudomonas sp. MWU16-30317]
MNTRFTVAAKPQQGTEWGYANLTQGGSEALVRLLKPLRTSDDPHLRDVANGLVDMLDQAGLDTKGL